MGSGNNFVIKKSKTKYVMILNPDTILKVTFVGLAALTFPHMILVDGIFRSKFEI